MFKRLTDDKVQYNDTILKIVKRPGGRATHTFDVTLELGVWPTDSELISLCDGENGLVRHDFGGSVSKGNTTATVQVYVD